MKKETRKQIQSKGIPDSTNKSKQIVESILEIITDKDKSIALFYPTKTEVDILPLIQKLLTENKIVSLPVITNIKERKMKFCQLTHFDELIEDIYKIPAPINGKLITKFDVIIVPCVTINKDFKRLGMGGGFYDSFLSQVKATQRAKLITPLFAENAFSDFIADDWDAKMDIVVTEQGTYYSSDNSFSTNS